MQAKNRIEEFKGVRELTEAPAPFDVLVGPRPHPVLPASALYGLAGEVVALATADSEASEAAVLFTFLTVFGALVGPKCHFMIGETKQYPRLFCAIVGATSRARKGTSSHPVIRLLKTAEKSSTSATTPLRISPGPASSGEGLIHMVRDASEAKDKETGDPIDPGVSDKRVAIIEGELGAALKAMQREGNTLSAIFRMMWDDGNIEPITKTTKEKATGAHICLAGHITSTELLTLLQGSDIFNGLANRFLWVCARRSKQLPLPKPMNKEMVNSLSQRLAFAIDAAGEFNEMTLEPEAADLWTQNYHALSRDEPGILGAVTARAEAYALRFAIHYALLDRSNIIRVCHLQAAFGAWQYCKDSARFVFGSTDTNPISNKILLSLAEGEKSASDINNMFYGKNMALVKSALADLQCSGRITQRKEGGGGKGKGAPKIIWSITPGFESPFTADLEEEEE
jgi:hypothetical protein